MYLCIFADTHTYMCKMYIFLCMITSWSKRSRQPIKCSLRSWGYCILKTWQLWHSMETHGGMTSENVSLHVFTGWELPALMHFQKKWKDMLSPASQYKQYEIIRVMTLSKLVSPCYKTAAEVKWWKEVQYEEGISRGLEKTSGQVRKVAAGKGNAFTPEDQVPVSTYLDLVLFSQH